MERLNSEESCSNVGTGTARTGEEDMCAICLSSMPTGGGSVRLTCGHEFHGRCLGGLLGMACPLCRARLQPHEATDFLLLPKLKPHLDTLCSGNERNVSMVLSMVGAAADAGRTGTAAVHCMSECVDGIHLCAHRPIGQGVLDACEVFSRALRHSSMHGSLAGFSCFVEPCGRIYTGMLSQLPLHGCAAILPSLMSYVPVTATPPAAPLMRSEPIPQLDVEMPPHMAL